MSYLKPKTTATGNCQALFSLLRQFMKKNNSFFMGALHWKMPGHCPQQSVSFHNTKQKKQQEHFQQRITQEMKVLSLALAPGGFVSWFLFSHSWDAAPGTGQLSSPVHCNQLNKATRLSGRTFRIWSRSGPAEDSHWTWITWLLI